MFSDHPKKKKYNLLLLFMLFSLCMLLLPTTAFAQYDKTPFPTYPIISENVRFWEDVYAKYNSNQLIVHDSTHPNRIYTIAPLLNKALPGAKKWNNLREKALKKKYAQILKRLAISPPRNVEERHIAAFFTGRNRYQQMIEAARHIRTQLGLRQRFYAGVVRSGAWIESFKRIFRHYNLPEDIAYLPHVESSFYNSSYSKAGASGMWQFTKSTGKQYLIIDEAVDERLDPLSSAEAAAQYLANSYAHTRIWAMAITSYNYGFYGSVRAVKKYGSYPAIFRHHSSKTFRFAARNFYPEFIAARNVAKRLEKTLRKNQPHDAYTMQLKGYVSLREIAGYFGISEKEIIQLNPAFRDPVINGQKRISTGYRLHLPATTGIKSRIARFPQKIYYTTQLNRIKRFKAHKKKRIK